MGHIDIFDSDKDLECYENESKNIPYCKHSHLVYVNWGGAIEPQSHLPQ